MQQKQKLKASASLLRAHNLNCFLASLSESIESLHQKLHLDRPLIIAITGDGALGKSLLAKQVANTLEGGYVISTDGFIMSRKQRILKGGISGDDPRAIDLPQLIDTIERLINKEDLPHLKIYDHSTGIAKVLPGVSSRKIRVLIVEGAYAYHEKLDKFINYVIFLDAESHVRKKLRLQVDTEERNYTTTEFEANWPQYQKIYESIIKPMGQKADSKIQIDAEWQYIIKLNKICTCPIVETT